MADHPIVYPDMDEKMGANICGPSVIELPDWITTRHARYYLYFADHRGTYIRLAFADDLAGPWRTHKAGCLDVTQSLFCTTEPDPTTPPSYWKQPGDGWRQFLYPHVASPDVHVVSDRREIRMYFHGLLPDGDQMTRVATSRDGIGFEVRPDILAPPYLRAFRRADAWYGVAMPDLLLRSSDGLAPFTSGPAILPPNSRHAGALADGDTLYLLWTELGEAPERIHCGSVDMLGDWKSWQLDYHGEIMRPERHWEGAGAALSDARYGAADEMCNGLRDPFLYRDGARLLLFYAGGGERGIGLAQLHRGR